MPTKKAAAPPEHIYQLKVSLKGVRPPVWRRLLVPSDMKLSQLHQAIQAVMGWYGYHLHEFLIDEERYGVPDPWSWDEPPINERRVPLQQVLGFVRAKALYIYDFGDGWEHDVIVEKILPYAPGLSIPVCIDGKRNCPPEDCGGVGGYADLLDAIANPDTEEKQSQVEWVGPFDPEEFSVDDANRLLKPLQRKWGASSKAGGTRPGKLS